MKEINNLSGFIEKNIKPNIGRLILTKNYFDENGILKSEKNSLTFGTGFKYSGLIISCAHILSLRNTLEEDENLLKKLKSKNVKPRDLKKFLFENIKEAKIEFYNGDSFILEIIDSDLKHDCSIFKFKQDNKNKELNKNLNLDKQIELTEGAEVAFAGFPTEVPNYRLDNTPFTVNEGIISAFPYLKVAGLEAYPHIQVNAVNLGGNSGAPLFLKNSGNVIGIISGNQIKAFNLVDINNKGEIGKTHDNPKALVNVFGITYVSPIKYIINLIENISIKKEIKNLRVGDY